MQNFARVLKQVLRDSYGGIGFTIVLLIILLGGLALLLPLPDYTL
ncbi:MAG: hypothetical protein QXS89_06015 [Sulfolobales archaeon]